jgi:hypothetical protein
MMFWAASMERSQMPIAGTVEAPGVEYVELGRTTTGEVIEMPGSKPAYALTDNELQSTEQRPW